MLSRAEFRANVCHQFNVLVVLAYQYRTGDASTRTAVYDQFYDAFGDEDDPNVDANTLARLHTYHPQIELEGPLTAQQQELVNYVNTILAKDLSIGPVVGFIEDVLIPSLDGVDMVQCLLSARDDVMVDSDNVTHPQKA